MAEIDGGRELLAEKESAAWRGVEVAALAENVMAKPATAVATLEVIAEVEVAAQ